MKKVLFLSLAVTLYYFTLPAAAGEKIARIDFEDAPVISVVQTLAKSAGFDLVLSGDQSIAQTKKATIHLKDVTLDEAVDYILRTNGFNYEKKDDVLLVSSLPQDLVQTAYKAELETVALKHLSAAKTAELLAKAIPTASFQCGSRANLLVIRGRRADIDDAAKLIASIDRPIPQILIESKVVEVSQSDSKKLGISYGNGTYRFVTDKSTRKTSPAENLVSALNALISDSRANVVANPRIATLDNQEALINIGNRIPFAVPVTSGSTTQWTVDYIDAGVKLKITPQLGQDGEITTFIQPEVSSISEWRTTPAGDFPVISTRNACATVRVKNGETIVIGGLLSDNTRENITRVPVLGYLPGLGLLFQNRSTEKEKTEIVFLITPHVI
ncbi:MAG: secretin and TonB N-terminal domain-containing protein [Candidatus Margulisbacteria bacterium]|nr:secretin and TonB N-terminal domain-containing protein [Candidatus Margulisiibacteriota bacterium]